jgi:ATP-binding cassette, subfamily B (MDR/TAP), member 1
VILSQKVASFNGEDRAIMLYERQIRKARKATAREGAIKGFSMGVFFLIVFCNCGLVVWLGGLLVIHKGYSGGIIINILFAVITGAM